MAYDEDLADRIREQLSGEKGLEEKRMFGGLAFLINGNMAVAASGQGGLLVRVAPNDTDKLVDGTTPALRRSALVRKSFRRRGLAGRLCPNPVLAEGKRLDTVVGPKFAVVTSERLPGPQRDEVTRRGAVVVQAPPGTELAHWLRSGHSTAAIVRPDRTVLRAGRNVADICNAVPEFADA